MLTQSKLARAIARPSFNYIHFMGGLDLVTPSIRVEAGYLRESLNCEADVNGGYTTGIGYERYDGRESPSGSQFLYMQLETIFSVSVGDTITGSTSAATAEVIAVNQNYASTFLITTKVVGTFVAEESLEVGGNVEATLSLTNDNAIVPNSAPTRQLIALYKNLAADEYRNDIQSPVGSGGVLGVVTFLGVDYAFRNSTSGTTAHMHKSTAAGWVQVPLGYELAFSSGGTTEALEGQTITGLISGANAVITRVMTESGSWAAGTAAGKFIFAAQAGTFQAEGVEVSGSGDLATITGNSQAITLQPDGRYEFDIANFGGLAGGEKLYGVDGVNRGFEFDGTVFSPIKTGMEQDAPIHVKVFKLHLFYSFDGSAQHSGITTPYRWSPIFGAAELAVGDTITGFEIQPGSESSGSLAIVSRNRTHILHGNSSADWNLVQYRNEVGAYPHTIQELGITLMLDDKGVKNLSTTQAFGNFKDNTITRKIQPWIDQRKSKAVASCIARNKSQYRLFFSDKYALYITTENNKVVGIMPQLFNDTVTCVSSVELSNGEERILFGSDNGMVYEMEKGTSHDGEEMEIALVLHFYHGKSPRLIKKWLDATMELFGTGYAEFNFSYELGYAQSIIPQPLTSIINAELDASRWDALTWDEFTWDGAALTPKTAKLEGSAENLSLIFRSRSDYYQPITFSGTQLRSTMRRQLRS